MNWSKNTAHKKIVLHFRILSWKWSLKKKEQKEMVYC